MGTCYYDGVSLGIVTRSTMETAPAAMQENEFFGVDGVQLLWGGSRGTIFNVEAVIVAPDFGSLASEKATLISYLNGIGRVFVDIEGTPWSNVVFVSYRDVGKRGFYAARGFSGVAQKYQAVFRCPA